MNARKQCLLLLVCVGLSLSAFATNAPTNLSATGASSTSVALSWTDNSADEIGFTFAFDTNAALSAPTYVWAGGVNTTSYTHTGRSAATTYFYKIKAEGNPDSTWTSVDAATTSPANLAASVISSSQINLSWTGNSGNTNIQGYTVATATNSAFTGASYTYVSGAGTVTLNKTSLFAGTTYYFKVKAEGTSDAYDSPFTTAINATTSSAAPNAPSNLSPSVVSSSQIDLTWTDNSTNETGFEVKRATDSGFTQNVVWVGSIQGTSYSATGLSPSTTYYFKVRAQGSSQNSAYSSAVNATTTSSGASIPNAPSSLSATVLSQTSVSLQWTDNSSNETGFEVKRATDSGFTQNVVWIGGISGNTYTNTGLSASTTYYYKVRAENAAGKSAYSNSDDATTSGTPPTGGVPISDHFFGNNAWMPYSIGWRPTPYNGKLWLKWSEVQSSGVQIMRYGGNGVDHYADPGWVDPSDSSRSTFQEYLDLVDEMRRRGIEPVLQVPMYGGMYSASQAADLVTFINGSPNNRAVQYWSIGNEPDLDSSPYPQPETASYISAYIIDFAAAMKAADPSIKILAPETAWYNTGIINALTDCTGGGGPYDVTGPIPNTNPTRYYVDYLTFHVYNGDSSSSRLDVTSKLMAINGFNQNVGDLNDRLRDCETLHSRAANSLKIAVTEANVTWENASNDSISGVGATSFVGGQWWAELMGLSMLQNVDFVTFWSVIEGSTLSEEKGYIGANGTLRPSYYHFQMMAQNFRGNAVTATDNGKTLVKAFAAKDTDQIAVIILNQETATNFDYKVRLNNDTITTNTLRINVDAGVAAETTGTIAAQSTILLVFNSSGTLTKTIEYKADGNPPTTTP
ncbi:MAG TPA: fibronectin type III domain-containing protein [Thermoanaerobaculia bacterium]